MGKETKESAKAAGMTREEALDILNNWHVPTKYAQIGSCPICGRRKVNGQYPHFMGCTFVRATRVEAETRREQKEKTQC